MQLRSFAAAFALLSGSFAAHADTLFATQGVTDLRGTLTINTTTGQIDAVDLMETGLTFNQIAGQGVNGSEYMLIALPPSGGTFLAFGFNTTSLVNYAGGSYNADVFVPGMGYGPPLSGTLVPVAVAATPEPSSFALLGTGLLGAAGVLRKRFA